MNTDGRPMPAVPAPRLKKVHRVL